MHSLKLTMLYTSTKLVHQIIMLFHFQSDFLVHDNILHYNELVYICALYNLLNYTFCEHRLPCKGCKVPSRGDCYFC